MNRFSMSALSTMLWFALDDRMAVCLDAEQPFSLPNPLTQYLAQPAKTGLKIGSEQKNSQECLPQFEQAVLFEFLCSSAWECVRITIEDTEIKSNSVLN